MFLPIISSVFVLIIVFSSLLDFMVLLTWYIIFLAIMRELPIFISPEPELWFMFPFFTLFFTLFFDLFFFFVRSFLIPFINAIKDIINVIKGIIYSKMVSILMPFFFLNNSVISCWIIDNSKLSSSYYILLYLYNV